MKKALFISFVVVCGFFASSISIPQVFAGVIYSDGTPESVSKEAKETLDLFRQVPGYEQDSSEFMIKRIKDAIKAGATSWEELETSDDELEELKQRNMVRAVQNSADDFGMVPGHDKDMSQWIKSKIESAVKKGLTNWKELKTTPEKLRFLVLCNQEKAAMDTLDRLRSSSEYIRGTLDFMAEEIRTAVKDGATTWERLGIKETELIALVEEKDKHQ